MHFIPSVARTAATKIAQTAKAGKAKIFLRSCAALCLLLLLRLGGQRGGLQVTAGGWEAGRRAWKAGRTVKRRSRRGSRGAWAQPFAIRPARLYYWKIRALEKLGRADEAERTAALLALRRPLDFYAFVLAYEGKYPKLTRAVNAAKSRALPERRWEAEGGGAVGAHGRARERALRHHEAREQIRPERAERARPRSASCSWMPPTAREAAQRLGDEALSAVRAGAERDARSGTLRLPPREIPPPPAAFGRGLQRRSRRSFEVGRGRSLRLDRMDRGHPVSADARVRALCA